MHNQWYLQTIAVMNLLIISAVKCTLHDTADANNALNLAVVERLTSFNPVQQAELTTITLFKTFYLYTQFYSYKSALRGLTSNNHLLLSELNSSLTGY